MRSPNFQRYTWTALWIIAGISIGFVFVILFASVQSYNSYLLLLWAAAYLAIGALTGFLFSVPKIIFDNTPIQVNGNQLNSTQTLTLLQKHKVEENTNLTQISDWLTKILIGAGLVEIKEVPKFILHIAKIMGQGIREYPSQHDIIDSATVMSAGIILYFITWGFISGYLIMRIVLTEQFTNTTN